MQKGQAAIEFIFLVLIVVLYIFTVTKPLIENAEGSIQDIENITKTNYEAEKITNTINKISLLGTGSKETLNIFIPQNSEILCNTNQIIFNSQINQKGNNPQINICPENICTKTFYLINNIQLTCQVNKLVYGLNKVFIEKINNNQILLGLGSN